MSSKLTLLFVSCITLLACPILAMKKKIPKIKYFKEEIPKNKPSEEYYISNQSWYQSDVIEKKRSFYLKYNHQKYSISRGTLKSFIKLRPNESITIPPFPFVKERVRNLTIIDITGLFEQQSIKLTGNDLKNHLAITEKLRINKKVWYSPYLKTLVTDTILVNTLGNTILAPLVRFHLLRVKNYFKQISKEKNDQLSDK